MHKHMWIRLLAIMFSFALVAAACGSSDSEGAGDDGTSTDESDDGDTGSVLDDDAGEDDATEEEDDGAMEEDDGAMEEDDDGAMEEDDGAMEEMVFDLISDDAVDGVGAQAFETRVLAGADSPMVAEGDPIVLGFRNTEGNPAGAFPDAREGAEAAVTYINNVLGGVGADYTTGTPGRPIELAICIDDLTPDKALGCGSEVAAANPVAVYVAVDFFAALEYENWTGLPIFQSLPISPADWNNPAVTAIGGGCVSAFPTQMMAIAQAGYTKVAIPHSDNDPGRACYSITQKPFLDALGLEAEAFPFDTTLTDLSATAQAIIDYGPEAVEFGVADIHCQQLWTSLRNLGYEGAIYAAGSCNNPDRLAESGDTVDGVIFGFIGYDGAFDPADVPEYKKFELDTREAALETHGVDPITSFARSQFSNMMFVWELLDEAAASGSVDTASINAAIANSTDHHKLGSASVDCGSAIPGFIGTCEFQGGGWAYNAADGTWTNAYPFLDPRELAAEVGAALE